MVSRVAQLRLQLLDQASGPAKKTSGALGQLEKDISKLGRNGVAGAKNLGNQLDHLREKAVRAGRFTELRNGMRRTFDEFRTARTRVKELEAALASATGPTGKLKAELRSAQNTVKSLGASFRQQAAAARATERNLRSFGLNSRSAITASQTAIRGEMAKTISQMRRMRTEAGKPMPRVVRPAYDAAGGRTGRMWSGAVGAAAGAYAGGMMLTRPVNKAFSYDETLTYIASTMAGEGSMEEKHLAKKRVSDAVDNALKFGGGSRDDAAAALNNLIASGAFQDDEALLALPSVLKTAHASGATSEDIANMAVGMRNNGVSVEDLQKGFDMAIRGGQLGSFELRDMARWFPQQLALARGAGLNGLDAVRQLVSLNQVSRTTSGTPDEAGNNLVNLLQKLNSRELAKTINETVQPEDGDPVKREEKIKGRGRKKRKVVTESFDWGSYMVQRRQEGLSAVDALGEILDRQVGNNTNYINAVEKLKTSNDAAEKQAWLDQATDIAENSAIGEIFADRQALMAALALRAEGERRRKIDSELGRADGSVERESQFVREQAWSKVQDARNAGDRANEQAYNAVSGSLGDLAKSAADLAATYPALTAGAYGAATALGALAAGAGLYGLGRTVLGGRGVPGAPGGLVPPSGGSGGGRGGIGAGRFGLGMLGAIGSVLAVPNDETEFKQFVKANAERSERWNRYLEENVGTPRSWLGMDSSGSSARNSVAVGEADLSVATTRWPIQAQEAMRGFVQAVATGGAEGEARATEAAAQITQALMIDGKLSIDATQLDAAIAKARQLGTAIASARSGNALAVASPSGGSLDPKLDGKRASGGPVKKGGVYQINEKGQELFAPGADGTIIPNHKIGGGGVTVHAPINVGVTISGGGDVASIKAAIREGVEEAVNQLNAKLSRSLETSWSNLAYGDA